MNARYLAMIAAIFILNACAVHKDIKQVKMIGFDEDVSKGSSVGQVQSDDCVFKILGYWLGGNPTLSRALNNARTQKTSQVGDVLVASASGKDAIRYMNNVTVQRTGFNAYVFGKTCIQVSGMGYK